MLSMLDRLRARWINYRLDATFKRFRREHTEEVDRARSRLMDELERSPDTALAQLPDCPADTFYILESHASGDLADTPEVRRAFDDGAQSVVVCRA